MSLFMRGERELSKSYKLISLDGLLLYHNSSNCISHVITIPEIGYNSSSTNSRISSGMVSLSQILVCININFRNSLTIDHACDVHLSVNQMVY